MNKKCKLYIVISLFVTWILTYVFYKNNTIEKNIMFIMFVPGITALIIRIITEGITKNIIKNPNVKKRKYLLKALTFSILFVMFFIAIGSFLGAIIYKKSIDNNFIKTLLDLKVIIPNLILVAFLGVNALGEEYGWRAFLLPELNKNMSRVKSTFIVGIVWALFHLPVVIVLTFKSNLGKPILVALVQGGAALVVAFAFSYCYFISNRVYPCVIMHGFWNYYNTYALGDIYLGRSGKVLTHVNIFITNGEGVFGLVLGLLLIPLFILLINKTEKRDEELYNNI